jgi:lysophospholipase L1-like esterase
MEWLLIGAGVVVLAGGGILWGRYLARRQRLWRTRLTAAIPVHSRWWKDYRERDGELLYVAVGDSAAQGIGASRPGRSYVGEVAKHIRSITGRSVRVVNLGVSGATVALAVRDQLPRLRKLTPDILTVSIGANDIAAFDPEKFEADVRELFNALPPHAIVADVPSFHFLPAERRVLSANGILNRLAAERGLPVAPVHARTRGQGLWGVTTQFAGDLFHPNDRGYRVWASAFIPILDAVLTPHDGGDT